MKNVKVYTLEIPKVFLQIKTIFLTIQNYPNKGAKVFQQFEFLNKNFVNKKQQFFWL